MSSYFFLYYERNEFECIPKSSYFFLYYERNELECIPKSYFFLMIMRGMNFSVFPSPPIFLNDCNEFECTPKSSYCFLYYEGSTTSKVVSVMFSKFQASLLKIFFSDFFTLINVVFS